MKKKKIALLSLAGLLLLGGCGSSSDEPNKSEPDSMEVSLSININDFAGMLVNDINYVGELKEVDYEYITSYFSIDSSTDAIMYANDQTCEEIAVFEAKDAVEANNVAKNIDAFLSDQRATFAAYSPEDANRIDNAVIKTSDAYVVLCVCDDPDLAASLIDDVFSGKKTLEHVDSNKEDANKDNADKDKDDKDNADKDNTSDDNKDNDNDEDEDKDKPADDIKPITSDGKLKKYDGITVIGDAGYSFYGYNEASSKTYASALNKLADSLDGSATVYSIPVVLASAITFPDNFAENNKSYDQNKGINNIEAMLNDKVKSINIYDTMMQHRTEYIYFRTDHHWTALGAYYAYTQYCEAKGITPEALDSYHTKVFDNFKGSYITDTKDADMEANPDVITAYLPNAQNTSMHVVEKGGKEYDWPIINDVTNYKSGVKYSTFAAGDNAITTLTNKDLNDGSACIVIKDSFGNAFVPFLVDHYQNVYEIDFRYWSGSLVNFAKEHNVTDILFVMNICNTGNSYSTGKINELCN